MNFSTRNCKKKGFVNIKTKAMVEKAFSSVESLLQLPETTKTGRKRRCFASSWQTHQTYWRREGKIRKIELGNS